MPAPIIEAHFLEAICRVIADTSYGLSGSEIGKILADAKIDDIDPSATKWKRLYNAFVNWQNLYQRSDHILNFLRKALHPARYINNQEVFENRRHEINKCLSFIGVEITNRGTLLKTEKATTISEAQARASHYRYKLVTRGVHEKIIEYTKAELVVENYFHSVFEAAKSVADRIRHMTGLHADGNTLVETAFSLQNPMIRINFLKDDSERSAHLGLANLIKGLFGVIRNPTAHTPKIMFPISEEEALDLMTVISLIHKRLDKCL